MSRDTRAFTLLGVLVYLLCVAGYGLFRATDATFPWVPAASLGVAVLLLGVLASGVGTPTARSRFVLAVSVVLVLYRTWVPYRRAASLVGLDTDDFAQWGATALETGDPTAVESLFYSNAPAFHTAIGAVSAVTGVSIDTAVELVSYAIAAFFPVVAFLLAARTSDSRDAAALAALLAALFAVHVERAFWPIAQSLGMVFLLLFVYLIVGRSRHRRSTRGLLVFLLVAMSVTHKLLVLASLLAVAGVSLAQFVATAASGPRSAPAGRALVSQRQLGLYLVITAVVLVGQWFYLTAWGGIAVRDLLVLTQVGLDIDTAAGVTAQVPAAASPPEAGGLDLFAHRTHALTALAVGAVAWLAVFARERGESALLSVTALFVTLVAILGIPALLGTSIQNPLRAYYLASVLLVVVTARALAPALSWDRRALRVVPVGVLVCLLAFQSFSAAAVVDLPGQDRVFLTDAEVHAKSFANEHVGGPVYTDSYYATQTVALARGPESSTPEYRPYDECLFDRTACEVGDAAVVVRSEVEVYRAWGNRWADSQYTLDWDPELALRDRRSQVYDSGSVRVFG